MKVRRELVEKELGPGKLDQRARQYFILGTSLAMLFDITVAGDFLRALQRLLEEWEYYCEKGAKGVVSAHALSLVDIVSRNGRADLVPEKSLQIAERQARERRAARSRIVSSIPQPSESLTRSICHISGLTRCSLSRPTFSRFTPRRAQSYVTSTKRC